MAKKKKKTKAGKKRTAKKKSKKKTPAKRPKKKGATKMAKKKKKPGPKPGSKKKKKSYKKRTGALKYDSLVKTAIPVTLGTIAAVLGLRYAANRFIPDQTNYIKGAAVAVLGVALAVLSQKTLKNKGLTVGLAVGAIFAGGMTIINEALKGEVAEVNALAGYGQPPFRQTNPLLLGNPSGLAPVLPFTPRRQPMQYSGQAGFKTNFG